jgi:hypothetical protein
MGMVTWAEVGGEGVGGGGVGWGREMVGGGVERGCRRGAEGVQETWSERAAGGETCVESGVEGGVGKGERGKE